ncbi:hypothetical protein, partial [Tritonibacter sp. SIMBA_163]|uniref:hypothetical protein n=1 Tax=Tritonibacter sp. SIMBA_163 TaxID=3080868 RepID=UPI00397F402C
EKCHLYMICSRPRITINPKKLDINNERISGSFIIDKGEIKDEVPFNVANPPELNIKDYKLDFPYTNIDFLNEKGEVVSGGKSALLFPILQT